ncbi:MAG TPA: hypothetical protein VGI82_09145 [Chitinophagaceae bacterium]|jgi:hypothetical protein
MKKVKITALILISAPIIALAQNKRQDAKADTTKNEHPLNTGSRIVAFSQMDQRKIYHWANGQRSTPTGREAGEKLSNYVMLIGDDSAEVIRKPLSKR